MKMKFLWLLPCLLLLAGCSKKSEVLDGRDGGYEKGEYADEYASGGAGGYGMGGMGIGDGGQNDALAGMVTAGEWRDLDNWLFWGNVMNNQDYYGYTDGWSFFTNNRVAVRVRTSGDEAVCGAKVQLKVAGELHWEAVTDNQGECNLWYSPYQRFNLSDGSALAVSVEGVEQAGPVQLTAWRDEQVTWNEYTAGSKNLTGVDIAFIVDATGSMGDEIDFLKDDVQDIIGRMDVQSNVRTAALFYRDLADDYVTRANNFTSSIASTAAFIRAQEADGGGDWEEAVDVAFEKSLQDLSWNQDARVKLAFWFLDAPPHREGQIISSIQRSVKLYASKGIRLIPVAASGIDKCTEILLRNYAILTDGTYVFITNDSGVGDEHIEATVGEYEVEALNDLILRLINEYTR